MMKETFFTREREHMIEDLGKLVAIPSVSEDIEKTKQALRCLIDIAKGMGLDARTVLDDTVGVIEVGDGPETIGILTHVDVVPAGDLDYWDTDPFVMTYKEDVLYGRGVLDDKGPVISCLYGMKYLAECGKPLHKKVQMVVGTQEEVIWTDMEEYVKHFPLPDYGFTPDGEFPICNVEKGDGYFIYHFPKIAREAEENGVKYIKSIDAGLAENAIPDKCTAVVVCDGQEETLVFEGKAAHSSTPDQGDNAIVKACLALAGESFDDYGVSAALEAARIISARFADVDCGQIGLKSEDQYLNGEFIHKNIVMPTLLETTDEEVKLTVNIRSAYGIADQEVLDAFATACNGFDCSLEIKEYQSPIYISRDSEFLQILTAAYEKYSGFEGGFTIEYGGTYAKAIPNVVNWGPVFPGQFYSGHEANESMTVKDLLLTAKIYTEALENLACSEPK
ncbi:MAG: M20/M25/M40 family metallo-hydrolase [Firmicutes bacterium]|nr:M20/M25/M40 family metallo-hydrolase [Bacillota bacterium]